MVESVSIDQVLLKKVQEAIEKNFSDSSYGVEELALEVGISRAQLYRRLHSLTGKPANQMIREYRLEKAFELLQRQVGTISEIAYQVGFSSPSYFNTCFSEFFGYPPGKVKHIPPAGIPNKYAISRLSVYVTVAIGVMAILVLIFFLIRSERNSMTNESISTQISIAVLPFTSLSDDPDKQYLADGVMDEILLHLSKIEGLRVMARTSVEQYRTTNMTASEICQDLDVAFLLEGSFRKYGDQARLIVQLIQPGKERHVWGKQYDREWSDILAVTSEVAQIIAGELQVIITPEERQLIEKIPTTSVTAHDLYLQGREEQRKYNVKINNRAAFEKAKSFYNQALASDPTFARAYTGLGEIYFREHISDRIFSENALDSALILADKALSYDNQLDAAYILKGRYYQWGKSNYEQAIIEYGKAITFNPNAWFAYWNKGMLYYY
ncbi:MAG: helix-turn-helix domain-containing protein, partial [Bacteroidales bacterium]|nr:helix-turn-helix domain-containing protein [Bacteroidales bacterium]